MSVARTARERVHQEISDEILAVARAHLARDGASALSLRSVARDLGLAPSALYRYYPSRDALLSALILSAYQSLAHAAERAAAMTQTGTTQASTTSAGTTPANTVPAGTTSAATAPVSTAHTGTTPDRTAQSDTAQTHAAPTGAAQASTTQAGTTQTDSTQAGALLDGAMQAGTAQAGTADPARAVGLTAATGSGDVERWLMVPRAIRAWALGHPHEWGLVFGTPVPGYHAPEDTIVPYTRIAAALAKPVIDAYRAGRLDVTTVPPIDPALRDAIAPITEGLFRAEPPDQDGPSDQDEPLDHDEPADQGETTSRGEASGRDGASDRDETDSQGEIPGGIVALMIQAWITLIGSISLELFGHWNHTILNPGHVFDHTMRHLATNIGLS